MKILKKIAISICFFAIILALSASVYDVVLHGWSGLSPARVFNTSVELVLGSTDTEDGPVTEDGPTLEELQSELASTAALLEQLQINLNTAQTQIEIYELQIVELQVSALESELENSEQITLLQNDLLAIAAEINDLTAEISQLESELLLKNEAIQNLNETITNLQNYITQLEQYTHSSFSVLGENYGTFSRLGYEDYSILFSDANQNLKLELTLQKTMEDGDFQHWSSMGFLKDDTNQSSIIAGSYSDQASDWFYQNLFYNVLNQTTGGLLDQAFIEGDISHVQLDMPWLAVEEFQNYMQEGIFESAFEYDVFLQVVLKNTLHINIPLNFNIEVIDNYEPVEPVADSELIVSGVSYPLSIGDTVKIQVGAGFLGSPKEWESSSIDFAFYLNDEFVEGAIGFEFEEPLNINQANIVSSLQSGFLNLDLADYGYLSISGYELSSDLYSVIESLLVDSVGSEPQHNDTYYNSAEFDVEGIIIQIFTRINIWDPVN